MYILRAVCFLRSFSLLPKLEIDFQKQDINLTITEPTITGGFLYIYDGKDKSESNSPDMLPFEMLRPIVTDIPLNSSYPQISVTCIIQETCTFLFM